MEELKLRKFDIKKMNKNSVCVLIAKRNSGKSFLIKDILYHNRAIPAGMVISRSDKVAHFYDQFIPQILIHHTYKTELLQKVFDRQQKAFEENWANKRCFLVFDDVLSEANTWKKDPLLTDVFYNGRHFDMLFLLALQAPMGITPGLRSNIDYTFILKTTNASDRKKIYDHYAGVFPTKEMFEKVLDACTNDYNCLVIDNTSTTNSLTDQVFYYKADDHPGFRMCDETFWNKNNQMNIKPTDNSNIKKITVKRKK